MLKEILVLLGGLLGIGAITIYFLGRYENPDTLPDTPERRRMYIRAEMDEYKAEDLFI